MIEDLIIRHYESIVGRGLINKKTKISDFISKMMEEDREMYLELIRYKTDPNNQTEMIQEIWDSVMTRLNFLQNIDIDLELSLLKNVQTQENRVLKLKE